MNRIKTGDTVIAIAGKDKGKSGTVLKKVDNKVVVEGLNVVKKHMKPDPNKEQPGGIVEMEKPLEVSNVAILNPVTNKPDRVGFKYLNEDKKKVRYFKSNNELVDID
jgi:large subunit ribosomal protein L24